MAILRPFPLPNEADANSSHLMAEDNSEEQHVCNHPRVEIDAWGQRLHGCIQSPING